MMKEIFKDKDIRAFFIVAMVIGIAMSFLISPWQIPDEDNHLTHIAGSLQLIDGVNKITESLGMDRGRVEYNVYEKVDVEQWLSAMTKTPSYEREEMLPHGISHYALYYIPAMIGMLIAIFLHLPTFWILQLGELFSLFFYVFVCSASLKRCPFKKGVMAIFMLAPMMMQSGSSFSYDALAIPLMFWIICDVLYLTYDKEEITLKDILWLILPWAWLTFIKIPYTFIVFLGLMLPLKKFHIKLGKLEINELFIRKYRWIALAIVVVLSGIILFVLRDNRWIQVIYGVIIEFPRTIYLLYRTLVNFTDDLLISSVGNFGWLSAPVSLVFAILFYVGLVAITLTGKDGSKKRLSRWDRGVVLVTFLLLTLMTVFSMVDHMILTTWYGGDTNMVQYNIREELYRIDFVGGLQGRYFMPFLSLFFLQFGSFEKLSERNTKNAVRVFIIVTYVYVGYILLNRFWIG